MYEQLQDKIDQLLVGPFFEALKAVECRTTEFGTALPPSRGHFKLKSVSGTCKARLKPDI